MSFASLQASLPTATRLVCATLRRPPIRQQVQPAAFKAEKVKVNAYFTTVDSSRNSEMSVLIDEVRLTRPRP